MAEMTLEEAFAAATVDVPSGMVDDIFVIDAPKRKIIVPDSESVFGVETDKDVERKYFRCPRIVGDNIDLYAHKIYVVYVTAKDVNGTFLPEIVNDKYWCDDVAVDGDCITFSWVLSDNVLSKSGIIAFKILAATTENGLEKTRWNTAPAYGTILMTVPDGDDIAERYPDIVTQLLERMDAVEAIATEEAMQGYVNEYLGQHPVQLDETLTDNTKAAPANLVGELKGEKIDNPTSADNNKFPRAKNGKVEWVEQGLPTDEQTATAVQNWLNEHPEATTTVQDGAITEPKIHADFLTYIKKDYVTPQMFGAKGDGVTNDTKAIQDAIDYLESKILENRYSNVGELAVLYFPSGTYLVDKLNVKYPLTFMGDYSNLYGTAVTEGHTGNINGFLVGSVIRCNSDVEYFIQYGSNDVHEQTTYAQKGVVIRNLSFDGNNTNTTCFNFVFCGWEMIIENVCISNFNKSAIKTDTCFDTKCYALTIQNCGKVVDGVPYYSIDLGGQQGTTNAWVFNGLHVEFTDLAIKFSKAEDTQFIGCKFEVGISNNYPTILSDNNIDCRITFNACNFMLHYSGDSYFLDVNRYTRVMGNIIINSCHFINTGGDCKIIKSLAPILISNCDFAKLQGVDIFSIYDSLVIGNNFVCDKTFSIRTNKSVITDNRFESVDEAITGILCYGSNNSYKGNKLVNMPNMEFITDTNNTIERTNTKETTLRANKILSCKDNIDISTLTLMDCDEIVLLNETQNYIYCLHGKKKYWFSSGQHLTIRKSFNNFNFSQKKINGHYGYTEPIDYEDIPTTKLSVNVTPEITGRETDEILIYNNTLGTITFRNVSIDPESYVRFIYFNNNWRKVN